MMTGISNDQSYSFTGLVDGALMIVLAVGIVAIVQTLIESPETGTGPAENRTPILSRLRRSRVHMSWMVREDRTHGGDSANDTFESMILPAPAKVQAAHGNIDDSLYPDNPPEKVDGLIDAMQSIANRMQALEVAQQQFAEDAWQLPSSFTLEMTRLRESLQSVFVQWAKLEPRDAIEHPQAELGQLAVDLEQQFDTLATSRSQHKLDDRLLTDLYAMIGTVRGLVEAMANTQVAIKQLNWQQWATPRF